MENDKPGGAEETTTTRENERICIKTKKMRNTGLQQSVINLG